MRVLVLLVLVSALAAAAKKKDAKPPESPLDRYVAEAMARGETARYDASPGSIWTPASPLGDLVRDVKAARIDDVVTVLVSESASAVATGTTKTSRQSAARASITSLFGRTNPGAALANLSAISGDQSLAGEGSTARSTTLSTTLSARITGVLPNGDLVVEGSKLVAVNSETQIVTVRGVARPIDIRPGNLVRSDRLAQLEVRINGKGVVNDAVRRPNFLYRLLLGLLPF